jgi:hypothetical protein
MIEAANSIDPIEAGGRMRSRIQIRTIEQLLSGNKPDMPPVYDILSAATAARTAGRRVRQAPTPEEIEREPQMKLPDKIGHSRDRQKPLPLTDDVLIKPPAPSKSKGTRKRKKKAS